MLSVIWEIGQSHQILLWKMLWYSTTKKKKEKANLKISPGHPYANNMIIYVVLFMF